MRRKGGSGLPVSKAPVHPTVLSQWSGKILITGMEWQTQAAPHGLPRFLGEGREREGRKGKDGVYPPSDFELFRGFMRLHICTTCLNHSSAELQPEE